jgi:hypothetical protein
MVSGCLDAEGEVRQELESALSSRYLRAALRRQVPEADGVVIKLPLASRRRRGKLRRRRRRGVRQDRHFPSIGRGPHLGNALLAGAGRKRPSGRWRSFDVSRMGARSRARGPKALAADHRPARVHPAHDLRAARQERWTQVVGQFQLRRPFSPVATSHRAVATDSP